jgi:hypothetical protein
MIGWPVGRFLSYPIAYFLPGYKSFCAVMTDRSTDDTRWLSYWLVVVGFLAVEVMLPFIILAFPFYYELKSAILLYLQSDDARPAFKLYYYALAPIFKRYEPTIDAFINTYSTQAISYARQATKEGKKALIEAAVDE